MISRASEYAIRALTYLAARGDRDFHLARDMAERLGVPAPFLAKILQPLVSRGLVASQRGRSGGFRLARGAAEVSLYEIVDAEEHLGKVRQCLLGQEECSDEHACPLHDYWRKACDEYLELIASTTLFDLVRYREGRPDCRYPFLEARAGADGEQRLS